MQLDQHGQSVTAERVLGEQVCWVLLAGDFAEVHSAEADSLLDPESVRIEVAQLAETLTVADTDRCLAVCPDAERDWNPKVGEQGLITQTLSGTAHHAVELGFA